MESLDRCLRQFPNISADTWLRIINNWIMRCDGFLFDMHFFYTDPTIEHLHKKTIELIKTLPLNADDLAIRDALAHEFEGLYFVSEDFVGNQWDSTEQSYAEFKLTQTEKIPNNFVDTIPHAPVEKVTNWLSQQCLN